MHNWAQMEKVWMSLMSTKPAIKFTLTTLFGAIVLLCFAVTITLSLPVLLWRWLVTKILAPYFGPPDLRAAATPGLGISLSVDYLQANHHPPRNTIALSLVLEGHVTYEELCDGIDEKWIRARSEFDRSLQYPELQQYQANWMGYVFWKQQNDFRLESHVKVHKIEEGASCTDSEAFLAELIDRLLNEKWISGESPWEMHLIQNYKDSRLGQHGKLTYLIMRMHHSMGDGFALTHLLIEQLFGNKLEAGHVIRSSAREKKLEFVDAVVRAVTGPAIFCHRLGTQILSFMKPETPFHVPDCRKVWLQHHVRGPTIPVAKLKVIKNKFGVSFAAVLDSAMAAALGKALKGKYAEGKCMPKTLTFCNPVPKPNHPNKLCNHMSGLAYDAPIGLELDSVERLLETDRTLGQIKTSSVPIFGDFLSSVYGRYPTGWAEWLQRNRYMPAGMSNFPGPAAVMKWEGRAVVHIAAAVGLQTGVVGVGCIAVSYVDIVQMTFVSEKAVLSRQELANLSAETGKEIEKLYGIAMKLDTI